MKINIDEANKNISCGYGSYASGAKFKVYDPDTKITIGKFTCIAAGTEVIVGGNHRSDFVTQFPFNDDELRNTWPDIPLSKVPYSSHCGDIEIGSDVWVGANSLILSGSKIGHGAIIGAGSVIRPIIGNGSTFIKGVPPFAIVIGNPAKIVSYRFDEDTIEALLKIAWWDWTLDKIQSAMPYLHSEDISTFISMFKGER